MHKMEVHGSVFHKATSLWEKQKKKSYYAYNRNCSSFSLHDLPLVGKIKK